MPAHILVVDDIPVDAQLLTAKLVNRITSVLRPSDLVTRMGGDEFAVVMSEAELDAAVLIAERLRSCIGDMPVEDADCAPPLNVTVSIGVAAVNPDRDEEPRAAFRRGDAFLYVAKRAGGNRVIAEQSGEHGARRDSAPQSMRYPW